MIIAIYALFVIGALIIYSKDYAKLLRICGLFSKESYIEILIIVLVIGVGQIVKVKVVVYYELLWLWSLKN